MALVLDTGVVFALLDRADPDHRRCVSLVEELGEDLVIPPLTLVEIEYWCRKLLGAEVWVAFAADVERGAYRLEALPTSDLARAAELGVRYEDLELGLVDASVVALCERLDEPKVATLDRRHFAVVQPHHVDALRLLPDGSGA